MAKQTKQHIPASQKRVMIAKDVILQLGLGKITAKRGVYVAIDTKTKDEIFRLEDVKQMDVREILRERMSSCNVCAKGALLICTILIFDQMPVTRDMVELQDLSRWAKFGKYRGFFSIRQIDLIESAFEGQRCGSSVSEDQWSGCLNVSDISDPKERLVVIMKNIITNNGTFKPEFYKERVK